MKILDLLCNNGFIACNKKIARKIGTLEAILLGELCSIASLFNYAEFYFSQEKISNDTGMSSHQISTCLKTLKSLNFVSVEKKGLPCKNWYTLNEKAILEYLVSEDEEEDLQNKNSKDLSSSDQNMNDQCLKNSTTGAQNIEPLLIYNNTLSNNTHNNTLLSSDDIVITASESKKTRTRKSTKKVSDTPVFKNEDYKRVYDAYFENCKTLFEKNLLNVEEPVLPARIKGQIKKCFIAYGVDRVVEAVKDSINHKFLVDIQYPLHVILSEKELIRLINKAYTSVYSTNKTQTYSSVCYQNNDRYDMSDMVGG